MALCSSGPVCHAEKTAARRRHCPSPHDVCQLLMAGADFLTIALVSISVIESCQFWLVACRVTETRALVFPGHRSKLTIKHFFQEVSGFQMNWKGKRNDVTSNWRTQPASRDSRLKFPSHRTFSNIFARDNSMSLQSEVVNFYQKLFCMSFVTSHWDQCTRKHNNSGPKRHQTQVSGACADLPPTEV